MSERQNRLGWERTAWLAAGAAIFAGIAAAAGVFITAYAIHASKPQE